MSTPISDSDHLRLIDGTDEIDLPEPEPTPIPPPTRKRGGGLLLAGAVGGGALVGGGVAAAAAAAAVSVAALLVAGGAVWWMLSGDATVEPVDMGTVEALVEEEAPVGEPEAEDTIEVTEDAVAEVPSPRSRRSAPAPVEAAAPAPAVRAPVPADLRPMVVKIITDPPAATVYIDGLAAGRTPLKTELEPGPHDIRVVAGKADSSFSVTVADSGESRFCYTAKGKKLLSGC